MVPRFNAEGLVCPDRHYCILPLARLDDMDGVLEFDPRRNHSAGAIRGVSGAIANLRPCAVASRDSHREVAERWMN